MKKLLVLLLVLAVLPLAVFADGDQETADDSGKVVVKAMGHGDNSNQEGLSWKRIVESFKKENPNIDFLHPSFRSDDRLCHCENAV